MYHRLVGIPHAFDDGAASNGFDYSQTNIFTNRSRFLTQRLFRLLGSRWGFWRLVGLLLALDHRIQLLGRCGAAHRVRMRHVGVR